MYVRNRRGATEHLPLTPDLHRNLSRREGNEVTCATIPSMQSYLNVWNSRLRCTPPERTD